MSISALLPADSPRLGGENGEHVRLLAELDEQELPPVIVDRATMRVIDGMHRLRACEMRGQASVLVRFYDGDEQGAFVFAVRYNTSQGLPLSLSDRTAATARIIDAYPHWSDRRIAAVTRLSAAAVAAVRSRSTAKSAQSNTRVGRDGRSRPVNSAASRVLASRLIQENPEAPLRQIAQAAGISPSTALDVRDRLREGRDPVPRKMRDGNAGPRRRPVAQPEVPQRPAAPDWELVLRRARSDPSLRFTDNGRVLLSLMDGRLLRPGERSRLADAVPAHCLAAIADLARMTGEAWYELATELGARGEDAAGA